MGEIQNYPDGTPVAGDKVPYIGDPAGTPALLLADVSVFAGAGSNFTAAGSSTNSLIVTGNAETVVAAVTRPGVTSAVVIAGMSLSQNDPAITKNATIRVRRTDLLGPVLWSATTGTGVPDVTSGDQLSFTATLYDDTPLGDWVLTVEETAGSGTTEIWSASNVLAVFG